ncbi:hypothetical protein J437_LFUL010938 [Ladona fulva]|uniref:Uncharacterized protein n=1 Tax=Ladona fulva TaxID=123851 RepID=A0A8K0K9S0_LADFU|nr:hypothetical protein J437_LFUL010938 [Ladona fulva]
MKAIFSFKYPNLSGAEKKDEDILSYCEHLEALHSDINQRFDDILKMNIPDWILFQVQTQKNLYTTNNSGCKMRSRLHGFHMRIRNTTTVNCISFIVFSGTWIQCGNQFIDKKKRNQLKIVNRGELRLLLTKIEPRITKLVAAYQVHPSH